MELGILIVSKFGVNTARYICVCVITVGYSVDLFCEAAGCRIMVCVSRFGRRLVLSKIWADYYGKGVMVIPAKRVVVTGYERIYIWKQLWTTLIKESILEYGCVYMGKGSDSVVRVFGLKKKRNIGLKKDSFFLLCVMMGNLSIGRRPLLDDYKKGKKINDLQLIMCGGMFKEVSSHREALKIVSFMEIVL
nr:hypothetical protein [Tanacetum cinerariifolium]